MYNNLQIQQDEDTSISEFEDIQLSDIYPNPNQPRKTFNIDDLVASIKEKGFFGAIAVVQKDNGYMIVMGERRYRACKELDLSTIKCQILDIDDVQVQEIALIENINREDLSDIEIANYVKTLWDSGRYASKKHLADKIGKSPNYISKILSVFNNLDEEIQKDIQTKKDVGIEKMSELSYLPIDKQKELYQQGATVKEIREAKKLPSTELFKTSFIMNGYDLFGRNGHLNSIDTTKFDGLYYKDKKFRLTVEEI